MMNPLPSDCTCTFCWKNWRKNGSSRNGLVRASLVVEMYTTASLVLRTTSTVTVRRRLIPGAVVATGTSCAALTDVASNANSVMRATEETENTEVTSCLQRYDTTTI